MKLQSIFLGLLFCAGNLFGQTNLDMELPLPTILVGVGSFERFHFTNGLVDAGLSNVDVIIKTPTLCPPEYTNVISNTNLFSVAEQKLLAELLLTYKDVTTNSGPPNSFFLGLDKTSWPFTEEYEVARFRPTNDEAEIKVFFMERHKGMETQIDKDEKWISFRTKTGDGYDVSFYGDALAGFRQFKHGQLDGLWADFDGDHCSVLMRFVSGKAVGKWLVWNHDGNLYMKAEFKEPYDWIGHLSFSF